MSTQEARRRADRARQVADVLRHQVLAEAFDDGTLPREEQLCGEFGVSRNTVREALSLLVAEGLVERAPRIGTTVVTGKYPHGLHRLMGLAETLREHGDITNEVRAVALTRAPSAVARRLRLESGDQIVYIERVRHLRGLPLSLDLTYLPRDVGEPLLGEDLAGRDIFVMLEEITGQPLGSADISVEAVNADPHTAALLDTTGHAALLMVERLTHLADGRPVDLEWIRFRGDRITMTGQLRRS
ncbi:GntR family transcriptional regulator [Phytohabitans aurantiacus]|jgi:GntR family transcriptional regulator|uniref:GntR-family transcriptional regulator n=1 Tax=Phytohabitans aurantiacus TaxID=3016789 RepID=A0ABQ5QNH2_9ACTN|nr:GntR family transcriptional regulator [Phytohabitans aurantiacus]GLH95973.1 putative GntR-family transcriptional regulator [Phytohabitans aurantiacus]